MKIEQSKEEFKPITITLETLEEAEILKSIVGSIQGKGIIKEFTDLMYNKLSNLKINGNLYKLIESSMLLK